MNPKQATHAIGRIRHYWAQRKERRNHQLTTSRILNALENEKRPTSCLFFTVHKCASTFINRLLWALTTETQYELRNYESAIWKLGDELDIAGSYQPFFEQHYDQLFRLRGEIYGPQRKPVDFPGRANFKQIFFLRDPRDVVVSAYYSFGFSHALPVNAQARKRFLHVRDVIKAQGIDRYALGAADTWVLNAYEGFARLRQSAPQNLFLSYDEFLRDTGQFIDRIAAFLEIEVSPETRTRLVSSASPIQPKTNIASHKRSGRSAQYLEELKPDTVDLLNQKFAEVLAYWGDGIWLKTPEQR